jgi:hypothetical protein
VQDIEPIDLEALAAEMSVVEEDQAVLAAELAEANVAEQQVDPGLGAVDAKDSPPALEIGGLGRGSKGASEGLRVVEAAGVGESIETLLPVQVVDPLIEDQAVQTALVLLDAAPTPKPSLPPAGVVDLLSRLAQKQAGLDARRSSEFDEEPVRLAVGFARVKRTRGGT